jgi:hypothetical protein
MELKVTGSSVVGKELTRSPFHVSLDRVDLTRPSEHSRGQKKDDLCGILENVEYPTTKTIWNAYDHYTAETTQCK